MHRHGFVGIVGRANVGKSTLMNKILAKKVTITANKPQTTRCDIRGIKSYDNAQIIYIDTPGLYLRSHREQVRNINRIAKGIVTELNVAVFVLDCAKWYEDDEAVLEYLTAAKIPIILVLNKVDLLKNSDLLFPEVAALQEKHEFAAIIPVSARNGKNVATLEQELIKLLPEGNFIGTASFMPDEAKKFLVSELIREKVIRLLGDELPYDCTVALTNFELEEDRELYRVHATIWVLSSGQKAIVIGRAGEKVKAIGSKARVDIEKLLETQVFLKLIVKIKK